MVRSFRGFVVLCAVAALLPAVVYGIVPDPSKSDVNGDLDPNIDSCVRICPSGDIKLVVTVIGTDDNPIVGEDVRVIFDDSNCTFEQSPGEDMLQPCAGQAWPIVTETTDVNGMATFNINASGCCEEVGIVILEADPGAIVLRTYDNVGSTDVENTGGTPPADGTSGLEDLQRMASVFLTAESCMDLIDCNDDVQLGDLQQFAVHFLHSCP